jgi:HAD superfamily hydrolase (TIGR01509 family)
VSERLIIFDFDGVIADSEVLSNQVLADELSALGYATTLDDAYRHYMGKRWSDCVGAIEARWGCVLPPEFADRCSQAVHDRIDSTLRTVAGVEAFLESIGDRPRCIASSSPPAWLRRCLDLFGLGHHFGDRLFSGAVDVTRGKPFPDLYLHAAAVMGADPARAIVIEDSPTGVQAGVAAGMTVIGLCAGSHIVDGHADRLREAGAHHIAASFDEVAALV